MKIGATDLNATGGSSFKKIEMFEPEANVQNLFRVFPPLFSMADQGRIAAYHKTHSIWVLSKNGKQYPLFFKCIQKKDKDTKAVTQACPFCEKNLANKALHEQGTTMLKAMPESDAKAAQSKQLYEFLRQKVWSTNADGKFYLNAMKADGKIGVLKLSYKHFKAFEARLVDLTNNFKTDATGMTGIFLNFGKFSPAKGSIDVTFSVDALMEQVVGANGAPQMSFKYQVLDEAVIAKMEKECQDLSLLYSDVELTYDQINQLAAVLDDKNQLTAVANTIFKTGSSAPAAAPLSQAPAQAVAPQVIAPVAQVEIPFAPTPTADQVVAAATLSAAQVFAPPAAPAPAPVIAQAPVPAPAPVVAPAPAAPAIAPNNIFGATGTPAIPQSGLSNVSDDEFAKLFG